MLYLINPENKEIDELKTATFQELGLLERKDLEAWVLKNPSLLGEKLFIITTEFHGFDKTQERLDVMAIDENGKLVIVELKRIDSGSTHLQAINYAAYSSNLKFNDIVDLFSEYQKSKGNEITSDEAMEKIRSSIKNEEFEDLDSQPRILLAAQEFSSETISAVLWLRSFGLDIACVKLNLYRLGDRVVISPQKIVPLPEAEDFIIQRERKERPELTPAQKFYLEFFDGLLSRFKKELPDVTERKARPEPWLGLPVGYTDIHFEWYLHRREKYLEIGLHFEKPDFEKNKRVLDYFQKDIDNLQKTLNEKLYIECPWGEKWARIYAKRELGDLNEALQDWAIETTKKFYQILRPKLDDCMVRLESS